MESFNETNKNTTLTPELYKFAPRKPVRLDKELFIAEYNSLRSEKLQRLSQQTTLYEISITAWALILGYTLEK